MLEDQQQTPALSDDEIYLLILFRSLTEENKRLAIAALLDIPDAPPQDL